MEEKKGNGLLIGLLILLIIGLIGFIAYDKLITSKNDEEEIDNLKQQVNTLTEEKNNLINNQTQEETTTENNDFINAVYYGFKEDPANNNNPKQFLTLFNDGTFSSLYVDSSGFSGTYEINNNKLILHKISTMFGNGDNEYEFNQDKSQIKTDDGITLQKY